MKIVTAPGVADVVRERGGRLFVWPDHQRCCRGAMYLRSSTEPAPGHGFRPVSAVEGFELWFDACNHQPPDELHLDVRGGRRKRVEAYWNGCVFVA